MYVAVDEMLCGAVFAPRIQKRANTLNGYLGHSELFLFQLREQNLPH